MSPESKDPITQYHCLNGKGGKVLNPETDFTPPKEENPSLAYVKAFRRKKD
jgi:hypothetical protein